MDARLCLRSRKSTSPIFATLESNATSEALLQYVGGTQRGNPERISIS